VTLVAEIGDIRRFQRPAELMAYLGLVPGERSSGATIKRGGITKTGNGFARKMLVESAWSHRKPARIGVEMGARMPPVADPVRENRLESADPSVWSLPSIGGAREKVASCSHRDRTRVGGLGLGSESGGGRSLTQPKKESVWKARGPRSDRRNPRPMMAGRKLPVSRARQPSDELLSCGQTRE
jgi:hypothetical protein